VPKRRAQMGAARFFAISRCFMFVCRSEAEWNAFKSNYNRTTGVSHGPYNEISGEPERYPCYAKQGRYIHHDNHRDEIIWEFFYLDEARELLPNHYSLQELRHFEMCVFPGDFEKSLIDAGMDAYAAHRIAEFTQRKGSMMAMYIEYGAHNEELDHALHGVLEEFMERRRAGDQTKEGTPA
jgi:hypothetical protein